MKTRPVTIRTYVQRRCSADGRLVREYKEIYFYCGHECAGVAVSLMGVFHNSLGLTMLFLVLSALFLEVSSPLSICRLA